jgi:hypothetical protein
MSLIRWGAGSELYIYEGENKSYTCCTCPLKNETTTLPDKEKLKQHILRHKEVGHSIGLVGHPLTYQSYDQLLEAVDKDDF